MEAVKKSINKYIRRNDKELHEIVRDAIVNKKRIHVSAPTGSG